MKTFAKPLIATTVLGAAILATVTGCTMAAPPATAVGSSDSPVAAAADVAAIAATSPVTSSENSRVPAGASWTQHYFPSSNSSDVELHADVLLPEGLAEGERVTPIVSVGPYFGHIGSVFDEELPQAGPSTRFSALITEGKLLERGYALVMVDGRGFGGSTGCHDAAGPGERADVQAAIDWAAAQPWSTGSVGMYGKSWDATTGLIGVNLNHDKLGAVVAQEPIWDLERNLWSEGVPRSSITGIASTFSTAMLLQGMTDDEPHYQENAAYTEAGLDCTTQYQQTVRTTDAAFWVERDFAERAKGNDTPLFFTQGFSEWNTEAEGMKEFLDNHTGPERAWLGPWDHRSGNDVSPATGSLEMGRAGWFDEVLSFYDEHLKGAEPKADVPTFSVQDNTGAWRGLETWPDADKEQAIKLENGAYLDDGAAPTNSDENSKSGSADNTYLTWSEPVAKATRVTGTPELTFKASGYGNVMVRLYDVAPDGTATWFNEQVSTVRSGKVTVGLRSNDWTLVEGHQLAVEIGTVQPAGDMARSANDWIDAPGGEKIKVKNATLKLELDNPANDTATEGERAVYLDEYIRVSTTTITPEEGSFTLSNRKG